MFDLFGTLVTYHASRTAQGFHRSHAVLAKAGIDIEYEEFLARWDGVFDEFEQKALITHDEFTMDAVCSEFASRVAGHAVDETLAGEFRRTYLEEWTTGVAVIPGVGQMLRDLAGDYTLAVITNTHDGVYARSQVGRIGADESFSLIVTSDEYGKRKPSPSIFGYALQQCGAAPETTLYVGDSPEADYRGATGAGLMAVLIDPDGSHNVPSREKIGSITELPSWLEEAT